MTLANMLSPAHQNASQRKGFFASLAAAAIVVLLHFPFDGYDIDHYVTTRYGFGPCPHPTIEEIGKATPEQTDQYMKDLRRCSNDGEIQVLPVAEWKSKGPIINWFGSVVHAITTIIFVLSLGGVWLWVFRTHADG